MVLTQQRDTSNYLASMEAAYRATEKQLFANITTTGYARASVPGYPNSTTITSPNDSVSKVDYNGTSGQKTGPSLLLKVMSGDTISMAVQSYYNTNSITATNSSFNDVLSSLAAGILSTATGSAEGTLSSFTSSTGPVYAAINSFLPSKDPAPPAGYPKAYLNWIFLDDQFNYVSSSSGSVPAASTTYPAATLNTVAPGSPINISKNGYLYIWVSNETQGWDVFFDNLSVQHRQGAVLEENHYYPFGLTMAGISDKAIKSNYAENKYKYNEGTALQNKEFSDGSGLEEYQTDFRMLDPQLGRFWQIDPLGDFAERWSPYSYAFDNPISFNDPLGLIVPGPPCFACGFGPLDPTPPPGVTPPAPPSPPSDVTPPNNPGGAGSNAEYPIYNDRGATIGQVDVADFRELGHGVNILLGVTAYNNEIDVPKLNWIQNVVTNFPIAKDGRKANVPFFDGYKPPYYSYYYDKLHLKLLYNDEPWGQAYFGGKYDFMFGDYPHRPLTNTKEFYPYNTNSFYWKAILSLVTMGPDGTHSKPLITLSYGFEVSHGNLTWYYPVPNFDAH